ncbi:helix-turn-helix transcriptional regulator [Chelativorans sp. YIM 93263]|uniref:helix-turn-helix transcriptional regulator n=1 Tax=Chelativorans sp. YIM 93263 TaxID=2906648 RepID=UPI002378148F|nr:helix-turn-helix transcriptional regulator [Chelativorans sp. YIM 93263]
MSARTLERTRTDLSAFLRKHRERLTPADVGLPSSGRRRTPGLRREEVAALAGVGITWYTWLEQGREIGVSEDFLLRLSKILKLDDAECCHLFLLAHQRPPPPAAHHWPSVSPHVQQMMDDLTTRPAYVTNLRWDVIAWNAAADRLFGFSGKEPSARNMLRMAFADPDLRRRLIAWRSEAPRLLENFRCDLALVPKDPPMLSLIEDLKKLSPDFRRWWEATPQHTPCRGFETIATGSRSTSYQHEVFTVDEHRHLRMVVYFASSV